MAPTTAPHHEACYRAVQARDARFDGRFCTAVITTGIYCRPSCPARTPKPANVRFYACAAAAEEAGFRACKRCRPESAPGDPDWDRRADLVARAVRLIADGAAAEGGVPGLARRLHVSERHLRRLFVEELGAGPLQVAASRRLALARLLLDQTDLPVTQVAFAAGFASIRRFNDAMAIAYGSAPSALRQRRRPPAAGSPQVLHLRLPARLPFAGPAVLAFLAAHTTPGVEEVVGGTYRRTVEGGILSATPDETGLSVELAVDDVRRVGPHVVSARRLFDLDCDPGAVAEVLGADPLLRAALSASPGIRLPGTADGFEAAVRTVIGQQVSVAGATTLAGRLVRDCGLPLDEPTGGLTHRFPGPEVLAAADLSGIGLTSGRAASLRALAAAVADGRLDLSPAADRDAACALLLSLPGIGPWTTALVAARALGDPDALPASDLALRRVAGLDTTALLHRAESWRPWRSYATFALWATLAPTGPPGLRPEAPPQPRDRRRPRSGAATSRTLTRRPMTTTEPLLAATHDTPAGPFTLIAGPDGVCAAGFTADLALVAALRGPGHRHADIRLVPDAGDASKAVLAWNEGDVDAPLAVAVSVDGTEFQQAVWAALRTIAPGHPRSYAGLAAAAGRPTAVRAAGRGCATNRVSLFVPCHRVVPAGGGVGGFLWGAAVKQAILDHEGGQIENAGWRSNASSTLPTRK